MKFTREEFEEAALEILSKPSEPFEIPAFDLIDRAVRKIREERLPSGARSPNRFVRFLYAPLLITSRIGCDYKIGCMIREVPNAVSIMFTRDYVARREIINPKTKLKCLAYHITDRGREKLAQLKA